MEYFPIAVDFLAQLIYFDPTQRPSAAEALAHPWLATYHDESDEPVCQRIFDRWRTIEELETLDEYRDALIHEVHDCRQEVRNMAALSPEMDRRLPSSIQEETEIEEERDSPQIASRSLSPEERITMHRRPVASRKASIEPGTVPTSIPEAGPVEFPTTGTNDPVVAYQRRSMFGAHSRTNSTFSIHRPTANPPVASSEPQQTHAVEGSSSTGAFPFPSTEYVVPARHRTASMYTLGADSDGAGAGASGAGSGLVDVRRLLRTLSTVSVYESGEGLAGGLADIAPIGKYIVQEGRTGDAELASEMPREIAGEETSSPSVSVGGDQASNEKRRFRV